ncbi:hypothetical protein [Natrinema versiforme]|uniref:Uncharacterized protein n=1 Tax=Natrinema versiforme JCM 10478 TaxID=1227496 RepID=L9Y5J2_9EURY|nr:hypothetical protein [Natrinema versiforme]ELY68916.1 hypothetical protein C489_06103 [Natrinema versiforme JCM 10478]
MSDESSGNVSFSIDEQARLFAFDIDRKGHNALLPLFKDISSVLEVINETRPTGGSDGLQENEIYNEVHNDLKTNLGADISPMLEFLAEIDYLEQTPSGNWKLKSSESSGPSIYTA